MAVPQGEELALVVEGEIEFPCNERVSPGAVDAPEGGKVAHHQNTLTGAEGEAWKDEVDTVAEVYSRKGNRAAGNVPQLDPLESSVLGDRIAEIVGIVHDLGNHQGGRPGGNFVDKVLDFQGGTPARAHRRLARTCRVAAGRIIDPGHQTGGGVQGDGSGVLDPPDPVAAALVEAGHQSGLVEEIAAARALVEGLDGKDVLSCPEGSEVGTHVETLEGGGRAVIVGLGGRGEVVESGGGIGSRNPGAVEIGDKTIVVAHLEVHEVPGGQVSPGDIERNPDVTACAVGHRIIDVDIDIGIVATAPLVSHAVGA